jgi:sensor histidine kinase regulating citrate/malate metabolism
MKLRQKITLILSMVITLIIIGLTAVIYWTWTNAMQKQVAMDAMDQAIIIAENEVIQENIVLENGYINITNALKNIQLKTKIQYLYVINETGVYFSHPLPSRINTVALSEELKQSPLIQAPRYYYDMSRDATVEGYAPIFTEGTHSGVVVVGVYNGRIFQTLRTVILFTIVFALIAIGLGILIAYKLARNIKREIFDLEPEEIAILLNQKALILENIGEGILATDHVGNILMINANAKFLLNAPELNVNDSIHGHQIAKYMTMMQTESMALYESEVRLENGIILKLQIKALHSVDSRLGYLFKLEDMSLVRKKAEELTNMVQLTQALRAQNHEFMNKLHTISGLIQLDASDKALEFIEQTTLSQQEIIGALGKQVKIPAISGLLLAKYSKAAEQKVKLKIHPETKVTHIPRHAIEDDITSILGNLIDNSIEALSETEAPIIEVKLIESDEMLSIEVKDNGPGMQASQLSDYMSTGFSTKGANRGYGLPIVQKKVILLGGTLDFENNKGLLCKIILPMKEKEVANK